MNCEWLDKRAWLAAWSMEFCSSLQLVSSADLEIKSIRSPDSTDGPLFFRENTGFSSLNFPKTDVLFLTHMGAAQRVQLCEGKEV